jgi:hypothetical protein
MGTARREQDMGKLIFAVILSVMMVLPVRAEDSPPGETLAAAMDVKVVAKSGQDGDRQSVDEAACYDQAKSDTGTDPFELKAELAAEEAETEEAVAEAKRSGRGAGVRGAARGAARGAVVGEIVDDDAGRGAEYGAAAGAVRGRRGARRTSRQAAEEAGQQGEAQEEALRQQIESFKKAFGACLEERDYIVTY